MHTSLFHQHTHWRALTTVMVIATLIVLSWLWAPGRALWDTADRTFFDALNQPIAHQHALALGWAIMNMRPVDLLVGLFLFTFILRPGWAVAAPQIRTLLIGFILLLLWMVMLRIGFSKSLHWLDWSRASPTIVLAHSVHLTDIFPGWDVKYHLKDDSPMSFPGDHASVLLIWAMLLSRFVSARKQAIVWAWAIVFSLPRLAAGAHWLSDDVVGGLVIAMLGYTSAVHTPMLAWLTHKTEKLTRPLFRLCAKLPLIGRWRVFTD